MYCPNCGTSQATEKPAVCTNCGLPLQGVNEVLEQNRQWIERWEKVQAEKRNKMIGAGAFLGITLVPIGVGVFNALTARKDPPLPAPQKPEPPAQA